jgi:hypothetical protein
MDDPPALTPDDDVIPIADQEDSPEYSRSVYASLFSGPIPPPALMKEYAEIDLEFPGRFIEIFERQQAHDHEVEIAVIANNKEIILNNLESSKTRPDFRFCPCASWAYRGTNCFLSWLTNSRRHYWGRGPRSLGRSFCLQQKERFFFTIPVSCTAVTSASRRRSKRMNQMNMSDNCVQKYLCCTPHHLAFAL